MPDRAPYSDAGHTGGVVNGTAYTIHGSGEPVVLIHGVGMEQAVWAPQQHELSTRYQVITYDMLGHGDSRLPPESPTLGDYARQLEQLLDDLGIGSASIVGHSMGALVALEFALRHPRRVRRVAALNAVFMRSAAQRAAVVQRADLLRQTGVSATIDSTIERWFGKPIPSELVISAGHIAAIMQRVNPAGYARSYGLFACSDAAHANTLADLAMPALFMTGEHDPNSTPDMSRTMAALAPHSKLEIIPDARHMMTVTSAGEVNRRLRRFLEGPSVTIDNVRPAP